MTHGHNGREKAGLTGAIVVTFTVVVVLLFVVWQVAATKIAPDAKTLQKQVQFLSSDLELIKDNLKRAKARQVVLEKEVDVLRQANRLLRKYESDRQTELGRLQSEVDFFSRLTKTGGTLSGLELYRAEVIPTESDRVFQFILTLTQNIRRASIISGTAKVGVEGTIEDRQVTLRWAQLSDGKTPEPDFRFKYFQQLEGYLTLPEGFNPTRLLVTLEESGKKSPIIRYYNWYELRSY
jgi:hypothetical protein